MAPDPRPSGSEARIGSAVHVEDDGSFAFSNVLPGGYKLTVDVSPEALRGIGWIGASTQSVFVHPFETTVGVGIPLLPGAEVKGRIVSEQNTSADAHGLFIGFKSEQPASLP
jgi:hypothetical protein